MIAAIDAAWKWFLSTTLGRWIVGVLAVVGALIAALAIEFVKGEREGKREGLAEAAQRSVKEANDAAQQEKQAVQTASEVQNEIQKLPDAPAQTVGTAAAGTAAGDLRDDGWVRSDAPTGPNGH